MLFILGVFRWIFFVDFILLVLTVMLKITLCPLRCYYSHYSSSVTYLLFATGYNRTPGGAVLFLSNIFSMNFHSHAKAAGSA